MVREESSLLLAARDLEIALALNGRRRIPVVDKVSFEIRSGETLAIIGESGCGKTLTALSLLRLEPTPPMHLVGGEITVGTHDFAKLSEREMASIRGKDIGMVFQEPMSSLNPTMTIGDQIEETLIEHLGLRGRRARERARELLELVKIPDPARQLDEYPHRLSGGMRQRVMIAMALACGPKVLIADEPTTALDVTIQAQILELLVDLQSRTGIGILLITHDFSVVRKVAQRVIVMYAGRIVEGGTVADVLSSPRHPYTKGLIGAMPRLRSFGAPRLPLLEIAGSVPPPGSHGNGCAFAPRCSRSDDRCRGEQPAMEVQGCSDHRTACWHPLDGSQ